LSFIYPDAEYGPLSHSTFPWGESLSDFLFTPTCLIEKVTNSMGGLLYLKPGYETDEGVAKDKVFLPEPGIETRTSSLSTMAYKMISCAKNKQIRRKGLCSASKYWPNAYLTNAN